MTKLYGFKFGSQKASNYTGLTPSFTIFRISGISAITAPGITETPSASGIYQFSYGPTQPIVFEIDAGASITAATDRYIYGTLDAAQRMDEYGNSIIAQGVSLAAQGSAYGASILGVVGDTTSSFGSTATDPTTVFGMLKRLQEFNEGNATFTKSSESWQIFSRGSSTLLRVKTLTNSTTSATKT